MKIGKTIKKRINKTSTYVNEERSNPEGLWAAGLSRDSLEERVVTLIVTGRPRTKLDRLSDPKKTKSVS